MTAPKDLFDLSTVLFTDPAGNLKCLLCGRWLETEGGHRARCAGALFTAPWSFLWTTSRNTDSDDTLEEIADRADPDLQGEISLMISPDELKLPVPGTLLPPAEYVYETARALRSKREKEREKLRRAREEAEARARCREALGRLLRDRKDLTPEAYARRRALFLERHGELVRKFPELNPPE